MSLNVYAGPAGSSMDILTNVCPGPPASPRDVLMRLQRGVAAVGPADVREAAARHLHPQAAAMEVGGRDGGGGGKKGVAALAAEAEAAAVAGGGGGGRQVIVVVGDAAVVRGSLLGSGYAEEDLVAVTLPDLQGAGPPA